MAGFNLKIRFIKLLDRFIGVPTVRLLSFPNKEIKRTISRVLFIRPGGIGDAVLLIPAIQAIKKNISDISIDILAEKRNAEVFSMSRDIRCLFHYDSPRELWGAVRSPYDVVIDTEQWHRLSAVVARMTKAPILIGFSSNERSKLFTHPIEYSHDDYEVDSFLHLIESLVGSQNFDSNEPFLYLSEALNQRAKQVLRALKGSPIVSIFPGASIRERKWGDDRFHSLAQQLNQKGCGIVVIGGKRDRRSGDAIARGILTAINLCGKLPLPETAAVLKQTSLLITGDSGIMHIGYGVGTKVLALFGPGREQKWAPRGRNCLVINKSIECSPCTTYGNTPSCRKDAACMKRIAVEEVFDSAMTMLELQ